MAEGMLKKVLDKLDLQEKKNNDRHEALMKSIETIVQKQQLPEERIAALEAEKAQQKKSIQKLARDNEHLLKKLRENNLIIYGIPENRSKT